MGAGGRLEKRYVVSMGGIRMKRFLMVVGIMVVVPFLMGAAQDRRISDNDGNVLEITSGGAAEVEAVIETASGVPIEAEIKSGTSIVTGINSVLTAGTREVLASSQEIRSVILKGGTQNSGLIYVGGTDVSSVGLTLDTGEMITLEVDNLADIYIDSNQSGNVNRVEYLGIVP